MTLTLIILFILIGLFLIWLEFFIVPGITVAGIGGTVLILGGIYYSYVNLARSEAHLVLAGTVVVFALMLLVSFRSKTWNKTSLQANVEGKIESINKEKVRVGEKGISVSRLSPMGKILVNGEIVEAKSNLSFIDEKEEVVILEVFNTNVLVKKA